MCVGKVADRSSRPLLGGEASTETSDGEVPVIMIPSSDSARQYSPSVSHDEKEEEEEQWEGLESAENANGSREDFDKEFSSKDESSPTPSNNGVGTLNHHKSFLPIVNSIRSNEAKEGGSDTDDDSEEGGWGGFDDTPGIDADGWGGAWTTESDLRTDSVTLSQPQSGLQLDSPRATPTSPTPTGSGKGKIKLSSKSKRPSSSSSEHTATSPHPDADKRGRMVTSPRNSLSVTKPVTSELGEKMKGRLKQVDIERLEQQALWTATEPDFFADMAPKIGSSNSSLLTSPKHAVKKEEPIVVVPNTGSSALQYQPSSADQVCVCIVRDLLSKKLLVPPTSRLCMIV